MSQRLILHVGSSWGSYRIQPQLPAAGTLMRYLSWFFLSPSCSLEPLSGTIFQINCTKSASSSAYGGNQTKTVVEWEVGRVATVWLGFAE